MTDQEPDSLRIRNEEADLPDFKLERDGTNLIAEKSIVCEKDPKIRSKCLDVIASAKALNVLGLARISEHSYATSQLLIKTSTTAIETLEDVLERGLSPSQFISILKDIVHTLEETHSTPFAVPNVHPKTIAISKTGQVVLMDWVENALRSAMGNRANETPKDGHSFAFLADLIYLVLEGKRLNPDLPPASALSSGNTAWRLILEYLLTSRGSSATETLASLQTQLDELADDLRNATDTRVTNGPVSKTELASTVPPITTGQVVRSTRRRRRRRTQVVSLLSVTSIMAVVITAFVLIDFPVLLYEIGIREHPDLPATRQVARSLHADPNQSLYSIVGAYRAVLIYVPEDAEATSRIDSLERDWENLVTQSVANGDWITAEQRLAELESTFPDNPRIPDLFRTILDRRLALRLLADARALKLGSASGNDETNTTLIGMYHQVLRLIPDNQEAQENLDLFADHYATLAEQTALGGGLVEAMKHLSQAVEANPLHAALNPARELIRQAEDTRDELLTMLERGSQFLAVNQLLEPTGENASATYQAVLAIDPGNSIATQGLVDVAHQVTDDFNMLLTDKRFVEANRYLALPDLRRVHGDLLNELQIALDKRLTDVAQASELVALAEEHMNFGYITQPEENNAVDLLNRALYRDPQNQLATELLEECAVRLASVATEARRAGFESDAAQFLEEAIAIAPGNVSFQRTKAMWDASIEQ